MRPVHPDWLPAVPGWLLEYPDCPGWLLVEPEEPDELDGSVEVCA